MKNKNFIIINAVIVLLIIGAIGYVIFNKQPQPEVENPPVSPQLILTEEEQSQLKASVETPPAVGQDKELDLSEEQINTYLADFETAIEETKKADFNTLQGLNDIAQIKRNLGDFQGAVDAWKYANFIRPGNSLSFSNLAALYHYDLREYDKAEEQYLVSLANDPDDIPTIRNFYELYFYDFKDNQKAEQLLLDSVEANVDSPDLLALTARFYSDTGQNEKAIEYYNKHLELRPGNEAAQKEIERLQGLIGNTGD